MMLFSMFKRSSTLRTEWKGYNVHCVIITLHRGELRIATAYLHISSEYLHIIANSSEYICFSEHCPLEYLLHIAKLLRIFDSHLKFSQDNCMSKQSSSVCLLILAKFLLQTSQYMSSRGRMRKPMKCVNLELQNTVITCSYTLFFTRNG